METLTITAPFMLEGSWHWLTWQATTANKHAAILDKAAEIGATAWDFAQADMDRA